MWNITLGDLLRRKDIIKLVCFFEIFNFFYLVIKIIIVLDAWISYECSLSIYLFLLFLGDITCILLNVYAIFNLYTNDYKIIHYNIDTNEA